MKKESPYNHGILPKQDIERLIAAGHVHARRSAEPALGRSLEPPIEAAQIQQEGSMCLRGLFLIMPINLKL